MDSSGSTSEDEFSNPYTFTNVVSLIRSEVSAMEESPTELVITRQLRKSRRSSNRISPPKPLIINIGSDDESEPVIQNLTPSVKKTANLNVTVLSLDDSENEDLEVEEHFKVLWKVTFEEHRFTLRKGHGLGPVFEFFAKKAGCPTDKISLKLGSKNLCAFDTIESLGLTVKDTLVAGLEQDSKESDRVSTKLTVKCRTKDRKVPFTCCLHPKEPLKVLFELCANELNCSADIVKIQFDGDEISRSDTAEALEIENDDCFDVYTISTTTTTKRKRRR